MKLSRNGTKLIIDFEGRHKKRPDGRYQAYLCPAGVWTIYAGITEGVHEGMVCTDEEGMAMFRKEIAKCEGAVEGLVKVELNQNQFDALVSFAFNVGSGALTKSTLLKKLNKGDFGGAAAEFGKWTKGGGKVLPGLVRRRAAEAELFLTAPGSNEPMMPQVVDVPKPVTSTIQSSRTIFGVIAAFGASLVGWFKDAVAQVELFAPVKQLGEGLGLNLATIVFGLTVAGLALALFARLDDAAKGKVVK
jgi:lysozyme